MNAHHELPVDVLMVDDRPKNLMSLEAVLADARYRLVRACSGEEALRYLLNNDCAVILLDVQMPGMDGFETASIIKKSPRSREIPIIFMTALSLDAELVQRGYEHGAVDYIMKPFEPAILRSKVSVFAELYRKNRQLHVQSQLLRVAEKRDFERELAQLQVASLTRERAAHERYRELVEGLERAIVWTAEPHSLVPSYFSPSAANLLGWESDAAENVSDDWAASGSRMAVARLMDAIPEPDRATFLESLHGLRRPGQSFTCEHRLMSGRGELWFQTSVRLSTRMNEHGAGAVAGLGSGLGSGSEMSEELRGLSVDITALKRAETTLRRMEQRQRFIAEASRRLSVTVNWELALESLAQLCTESFVAQPGASEAAAPQSTEWADAALFRSLDRDGSWRKFYAFRNDAAAELCAQFECLDREESGAESLLTCVRVPLTLRDENLGELCLLRGPHQPPFDELDRELLGEVARRTEVMLENVRLFEKAQEANRSKTTFLANVSHEIRTPLAAVLGFAELLASTTLNPEERATYLERVRKGSQQLTKLIEEVLDLSKIEAGRIEIEKVSFSLQELLQDTRAMFRTQLEQKNLRLHLELPERMPASIVSDPTRLKQILINLLGNAAKFTATGDIWVRVEIFERGPRPEIHVEVRDSGVGIDPQAARRLFQPFVQADASTTRRFGGTGLGLALSRRLARALGGELELSWSRPGEGSSFLLSFDPGTLSWETRPTPASLSSRAPAATEARRFRLQGLQILLAEDSPDNQFLMSCHLRHEGAVVTLADNGLRAVELARAQRFDAILMDIQMPELDGLEATAQLRAAGHREPILAVTAHAFTEERERCLRMGCNDHITKPVDRELLIRKIAQFCADSAAGGPARPAPLDAP